MKGAYYNEHDPFAAAWLQSLIAAGHIAAGDVDTRDIQDVTPDDLRGYRQCHFFAGIGGWSLALRMAGWADDHPVWTGSCPCQPFSAAGQRGGFADERHLWPAFHWLIGECRPAVVFGEQVSSPAGRVWLDLVSTDLEGLGYAVGAADLAAASVGAPHIRQRLYWVADTAAVGHDGRGTGETRDGGTSARIESQRLCAVDGADDSGVADPGREGRRQVGADAGRGREGGGAQGLDERSVHGGDGDERVAHPRRASDERNGRPGETPAAPGSPARETQQREWSGATVGTGSTLDPWSAADWIPCVDGVARPVEPGTFPLATRIPARLGRLRGYGNSIVPPLAAAFIEAYLAVRR